MKNKPTISSLSEYIKLELRNIYPKKELASLIYIIFHHLLNYTKIDIHIKKDNVLSEENFQQVLEIIRKLKEFIPIQYILGETEFFNLKFSLNRHVLIPRSETEELVDWIIRDLHFDKNILDIGTGSGCIAICLSKYLKKAKVDALDISVEALKIAKENANQNGVDVKFFQYDILSDRNYEWNKKYDIIVSNPPYVTESEKKYMHQNVINHEPKLALFVPNENPLKFYNAIFKFSKNYLDMDGIIYLEINESFAQNIIDSLKKFGYKNIKLRKDINGKNRMIKAQMNAG